MNNAILEGRKITKTYFLDNADVRVLKGIDIHIFQKEILSILGVSGVGKSTLLHILSTLDFPTEGQVFVEGKEVFSNNSRAIAELRNTYFGFVFQACYLMTDLNVLENVMLPAIMRGISRKEAAIKAKELLIAVGLSERAKYRVKKLSGGEEQRVAIARALINKPKIVFCDEPTGNLDESTSLKIFDLFEKFNGEYGTTFVIVTHDEDLAARSHRVVRMIDGQISSIEKRLSASTGRTFH